MFRRNGKKIEFYKLIWSSLRQRGLLYSILILFALATSITGGTYAWFTDGVRIDNSFLVEVKPEAAEKEQIDGIDEKNSEEETESAGIDIEKAEIAEIDGDKSEFEESGSTETDKDAEDGANSPEENSEKEPADDNNEFSMKVIDTDPNKESESISEEIIETENFVESDDGFED